MDTHQIERGIALVLRGLGVDAADRNYKDTPKRVARMYKELFSPKRNNRRVFPEKHDHMVVLRGHDVVGLCPHHLMPVTMRVYLGYIPNGRVLGLSKLARAVEEHLTAPVLQEAFTDLVAHTLHRTVDCKGVGCVVVGQHGCMRLRGVRTAGDVVTSAMTGIFLSNPPVRDEFFRIIGRF